MPPTTAPRVGDTHNERLSYTHTDNQSRWSNKGHQSLTQNGKSYTTSQSTEGEY
jgi:hypothetical protein